MSIINTDRSNINEWVDLSVKLFPDNTFDEMFEEYNSFLSNQKEIGFLYEQDSKVVGFMNVSIRKDYVNGTDTSPVLFIEAIYVLPEYRSQGIGKTLLAYAEKFAKENEIKQVASDCLMENRASELFHKSCGFEETERVIYFVKNV